MSNNPNLRPKRCGRAECAARRAHEPQGWTCAHEPTGRWEARYRDPNGRRRGKTFNTKTDARRFLATVTTDVLRGDYIDPRRSNRRYAEIADMWRETWLDLKPSTVARYESALRTHLLPEFGAVRVSQITHERVQAYVTRLSRQGMSPGTVSKVYAVLRSSLSAAIRADIIKANPCAQTKLPQAPHKEMLFLSAAQVTALAEAVPPRYRTLVYFAAYTGLRAGEIGGLRVRRLDLLRGTVHVAESLVDVDGALKFGDTKNRETRTVALPRFLREMLAEHLRAAYPDGAPPDALVFGNGQGGPMRHQNFYRRHFRPAVVGRAAVEAKQGRSARPAVPAALPPELRGLRFHDLRHTCASLLIAQGAHPKAIQERLGHSTINITMDRYGHLLPSLDEALTDGLDATYHAAQPAGGEVVVLR